MMPNRKLLRRREGEKQGDESAQTRDATGEAEGQRERHAIVAGAGP
jgi:hypothetical protein